MEKSLNVFGFDSMVFLSHHRRADAGYWQAYNITEVPRDADGLGAALDRVLNEPWPDVFPGWRELMKPVLRRTKMSSERRFTSRCNCASVHVDGDQFRISPLKPDARPGYSGVAGAPAYELQSPTTRQIGSMILQALDDSAAFDRAPSR